MPNTAIYAETLIESTITSYNGTFKPTYLYIKEHSVTGLKYFGKTTGTEKYLLKKYLGSGGHWKDHIRVHGKEHIVTTWHKLFIDIKDCVRYAVTFSEENNIVKSNNWANKIIETGLNSVGSGDRKSDETKLKMRESRLKYYAEHPEEIERRRLLMLGDYNPMRGKTDTIETKGKKSIARKLYYENPDARKRTSDENIKRYEDPTEIEKLSIAQKKRWSDPDERKKRSEMMTGKKRGTYKKKPL